MCFNIGWLSLAEFAQMSCARFSYNLHLIFSHSGPCSWLKLDYRMMYIALLVAYQTSGSLASAIPWKPLGPDQNWPNP